MFTAIHINVNSIAAFSVPLRRKWVNFLFCFMFPKVGSTVVDLCFFICFPFSVFSLCRIDSK